VTIALLAAAVALYYRVDAKKRAAFELQYPRAAALVGMVAAIVPFLPMLLDNGRRLVTPPQPVPKATSDKTPVPEAPWGESPQDTYPPPAAKE